MDRGNNYFPSPILFNTLYNIIYTNVIIIIIMMQTKFNHKS